MTRRMRAQWLSTRAPSHHQKDWGSPRGSSRWHTSLAPERADAVRLLALVRGQWQIENHSHWVRDVTFDEDRSQVRCGNMPQVMATLRNTVIGLMRWAGYTNMAAACRRFAAQPTAALHLIGITLEN
jgi:hypothetical protein